MQKALSRALSGDLLDEQMELSLVELCRACRLRTEDVFELMEFGVIKPLPGTGRCWRFAGSDLRRLRIAARLREDLEINNAGVALALDLLEELRDLRATIAMLKR